MWDVVNVLEEPCLGEIQGEMRFRDLASKVSQFQQC